MDTTTSTDFPPLIKNKRFSREVFAQLLPIFIQEIKDEFSNFIMAFDTKNIEDTQLILHKLSGISKSYGAIPIVKVIMKVEKNILNNLFIDLDIKSLQESLQILLKYIEEEYQVALP